MLRQNWGAIVFILAAYTSVGCREYQPKSEVNLEEVESRAVEVVNLLPSGPKNNTDIALETKAIQVDNDGSEHVRFQRKYKGLEIIGGDLITHKDRTKGVSSSEEANSSDFKLDSTPSISKQDAETAARKNFHGIVSEVKTRGLVIFAHNPSQEPKLAWDVLVEGVAKNNLPSKMHYFIDANKAELLASWDDVFTVLGTGNGFHHGTFPLETNREPNLLYSLKDPTRGNLFTVLWLNKSIFTSRNNIFGDGRLAIQGTTASDAQFATAKTWDYFKLIHGRNGVRNNGIGSKSEVGWGNYSNAFWSEACFCATYGDGDSINTLPFVTLDIVGHELTHGITSATAKLVYAGESGGLNEATSDIFGTMVEFYANIAKDVPDYTVGEKVFKNGTSVVRYMHNPILDGLSPSCYTPTLGILDVHKSSGVANHFFYLIAEGSNPLPPMPQSPTCNGSKITGIGRDAASKIWYRALTVYMLSNTDYRGARIATIKSAEDLFGINSTQALEVAKAWSAVSVESTAPPSPAVNVAPTSLALSQSVISENSPIGTAVGILTTQDPNVGDTFTYALSGIDAAQFRLSGNVIITNAVFNFEAKASYSIIISSTDSGGLSVVKASTITVANVNETPTNIHFSAVSVAQAAAIGTVIGTLTTTDPDIGASFTYTISGADSAAFRIVGSQLVSAVTFNRAVKSIYRFTVTTRDNAGALFSINISIRIL